MALDACRCRRNYDDDDDDDDENDEHKTTKRRAARFIQTEQSCRE
jgi:hypothetical protein